MYKVDRIGKVGEVRLPDACSVSLCRVTNGARDSPRTRQAEKDSRLIDGDRKCDSNVVGIEAVEKGQSV